MALEKLEVKGFKSIRDASLSLTPLNVLIGSNGAGKSNLISVFRFLNQVIEEHLQLYVQTSGGADSLLYLGEKTSDQMQIKVSWKQSGDIRNGYQATWKPTKDDSLVFVNEAPTYQSDVHIAPDKEPYFQWLGEGHRESWLPRAARLKSHDTVASHVLKAMQTWKVYHFHDTSDSAKVKKLGELNDNLYLRPDASNLAAFLFSLKEESPHSYDAIRKTITLVAPFFKDFLLRPFLSTEKIQLEWIEDSSDFPFRAHHLSDGTLRFICLATLLLQPKVPETIVIDEPELGLHPYAITVLASLMKSASMRCQVIVSTQSVELLNECSLDDIVVVERLGTESTFHRPDPEKLSAWLNDYALGELWQKNVLGGRPTK